MCEAKTRIFNKEAGFIFKSKIRTDHISFAVLPQTDIPPILVVSHNVVDLIHGNLKHRNANYLPCSNIGETMKEAGALKKSALSEKSIKYVMLGALAI